MTNKIRTKKNIHLIAISFIITFFLSPLLFALDKIDYTILADDLLPTISCTPLWYEHGIFNTDALIARLKHPKNEFPIESTRVNYESPPENNTSAKNSHQICQISNTTHNKNARFSCFCGIICKNEMQLLHHINTHKQNNDLFCCNSCEVTYATYEHLAIHVAQRHTVTFKEASLAISPLINKKKREVLLVCCEKKYESLKDLRSHLKRSHALGAGYRCPCDGCNYFNRDFYILFEHYLTHLDPELFNCLLCGAQLSSAPHLIRHYQQVKHDNQS